MGDLNTNLLSPSSLRSCKLLDIIESASLHVLPLNATHHNTEGDDTWLDLMITSAPTLVSFLGQYPAPGFSHHDLIYLSYTLKPPKSLPKVLYRRCFGRMDVVKLCKDAATVEWELLTSARTIDEKIEIFNTAVTRLYDVHAPIRRVRRKRPPAPWMTEGVRIAMRRRDRAFAKFRRDRCDDNWALTTSVVI
ncbi:uncharacterized protein LOC142980762 [Anticarsia gemmatalis]|uniref:uncharacterized protein LOC142980762 n=1 Tax=Anticarsia gemmatalis TaxID=129554 RepID=UPI003F768F5C